MSTQQHAKRDKSLKLKVEKQTLLALKARAESEGRTMAREADILLKAALGLK